MCSATGDQYGVTVESDGAGGVIAAWEDHRGANADVYAQRLNSAGAIQWPLNGAALCSATGDQLEQRICSDGGGGAIVAWRDGRSLPTDIYARRITSGGSLQWAADGVVVCGATGAQFRPYVASDLAGGAVIAWGDARDGVSYDVYAQRVNGAGTAQWTADGVALCAATGDQAASALVSDGSGGAIAAWLDFRYSFDEDVFIRGVNAAGALQGPADGVPISTAPGRQVGHAAVSNGAGGAILAWQDLRSGTSWDVYAHRVGPDGAASVPVVSTEAVWLGPAFPNPTHGGVELRLRVPARTAVTVEVHDLQGRLVRRLTQGTLEPGPATVRWDGRDQKGRVTPSGVYLCTARAEGASSARRIVKVK
jgi:hypothetical protein